MRAGPNRQSTRLRDWDYRSPGAYFVTIVTHGRQCWFGDVHGGQMRRNAVGGLVASAWLETPQVFEHVELDEWIVMPNHLHGILHLHEPSKGQRETEHSTGTKPGSLGAVVQRFKSVATRRIRRVSRGSSEVAEVLDLDGPFAGRIWLRSFFDHIIRDEESLDRIRRYIRDNPARWEQDDENPGNP